jgi:CRISPR/Cas system CSM-associated protein Csm3 (group 7 of RAMP superfamily)
MSTFLTIRFQGSVHQGSGYGIAGLVDRGVLRDSAGVPYLSGSSLKGRMRHAMSRMDGGACATGEAGAFCRKEPLCRICRLFGSPWSQAEWEFEDAYPVKELKQASQKLKSIRAGALFHDSSVRIQTAMDRCTGKVQEQLLFSTETLDGGWEFEARVYGVAKADLEALRHCALLVTHLGAGRARGFGLCVIEVQSA